MPNEIKSRPDRGILVVLEGTDGSGKATQAALLADALERDGLAVVRVSFPSYGSPMAAPVERYLKGAFGSDPSDVGPHAASVLYAVDRFGSFREAWGEAYLGGAVIVADRYTTSNAVHQTAKLPIEKRGPYLDWLHDLEHEKMGIPRPDLVLYLDVEDAASERILKTRADAAGTLDIHERNVPYLRHCKRVARDVAAREGWTIIKASRGGEMRPIPDVHAEILAATRAAVREKELRAKGNT